MTRSTIPLSVLDLVPIASGSTAATALRNTLDLAQRAEAAGYTRYWIAEHHLNPGVAGVAPALVVSLVAAATEHIRVGSGAVQLGHHTPLSVVEQFGIVDALHPGRIDLGLGRSGFRRPPPAGADAPVVPPGFTTPRGLVIPEKPSLGALLLSPRYAAQRTLLQQPGAETPPYEEQIAEILALLRGEYCSDDGYPVSATPGEGAQVEVWILGSSGGDSAQLAGELGLPFGANYHVSPATVLEAVESYRRAFRPSTALAQPHVLVSADVVVAPDDATARELATGYGLWVLSIRSGQGAIDFPTPKEAAEHEWSADELDLVADRIATQFVGSPSTVADQLQVLADETGADELLITTITHDHADRVRSYELLAHEWDQRAAASG
jgi:alkanesulfonate monooxygenase SsuD/methylene tetrahydromethanopterin reductase-like flavin-dependent oxidoreductase (luciferase family)